MVQRERTFVVVAPGVYHFGFNMGPNICEAVNFLSDISPWREFGLQWKPCSCGMTEPVELGLEKLLGGINVVNTESEFDS